MKVKPLTVGNSGVRPLTVDSGFVHPLTVDDSVRPLTIDDMRDNDVGIDDDYGRPFVRPLTIGDDYA
jgi:hypothetical protein